MANDSSSPRRSSAVQDIDYEFDQLVDVALHPRFTSRFS
jgi:hypothetical protein